MMMERDEVCAAEKAMARLAHLKWQQDWQQLLFAM
jgi:hypothetical protein